MIKKHLLFMMVTIFFTGCTMMRSDYQAPEVQVPEQWQQRHIAQDVKMDPWWYQFNDPQLNTYIEQVLQTNNDLNLATLTLKKARLQMRLATDSAYPQLGSSTSGGMSKPLDGGEVSENYSANLSASYEVDLWGKVSADIDQAKWSAMATQEDRESTAQSLVATTASLYWQIGYLNQKLALAEKSIQDAQNTLSLIQRQYDVGAVGQLDVLEAQRSLLSMQAQQRNNQQQWIEANNAFAILFDQPPQDMGQSISHLPDVTLPSVASGVPADVLIRRPDVKAAVYQIKSALANKDAADLAYLPSLSLTGSLGSSSSELSQLLSNPVGSLGASIALPFLQWNDMKNNQAIADLDYQSAIINYRKVLYAAFEDVENALSARENLLYQGQTLVKQYQAAAQSEAIYEARYRYGSTSIMEYLNSQDNTRNAELAVLENRYNQYLAQVALYQALGGEDVAPAISQPQEMD